MRTLVALLALSLTSALSFAQPAPAPTLVSPEVHADGTITFRYVSTTAKSVGVALEGTPTIPMVAGDGGVWTVTTAPMLPEYYGYRFVVDGQRVLDSRNVVIRPNLLNAGSVVHVTAAVAQPWDLTDVPHGATHHHLYRSKLAGEDRDLYVYTPPGYDARRKAAYPVLYLLHGLSDGADGWLGAGQANLILDNLLAQGKIKPMMVVMPLGYGTMRMITEPAATRPANSTLGKDSQAMFTDQLLHEIMPMIDASYNTAHDAEHRAMAGLSLGGAQTIATGLNHPEVFHYIGAFSSALATGDPSVRAGTATEATYNNIFATLVPQTATQAPFSLVWTSCGNEDGLINVNRRFGVWAKANVKGKVVINETPGMHTWLVWRDNLVAFAPLLFAGK